MASIIYNSFDGFLQANGTSFAELMSESRLSRPDVYDRCLVPLNTKRSHIQLSEYFIEGYNMGLPYLISSLLIWSATIRGHAFWYGINNSWETYSMHEKNVDNMPIFSEVPYFNMEEIKDNLYGENSSLENI